MNLNKVQLIGRITRDPEMKNLPSGVPVTNFSIATNRVWKDQQGQKQEETDFHNCVAFNKTAEIIKQYLGKGSLVYVEGRLQTRSWDDKTTGEKKYRTEIMIENVQLPPKSLNSGASPDGSVDEATVDFGTSPSTPTPAKKAVEPKGMDLSTIDYGDENINVDDIPF